MGCALRLIHYLSNPSLWMDEALLALNIISRPLEMLLGLPLAFQQGAPPGFLILERSAVVLFGPSELALRLFPLLAGLCSLLLMLLLCRRIFGERETFFIVAFFAVIPSLINYSAEVKQYSTDVMIAVGLLLVTEHLRREKLFTRNMIPAMLCGVAGVWFSHPAIFVLAGAGTVAAMLAIAEKRWGDVYRLSFVGIVWLSSFGLFYVFSLHNMNFYRFMLGYYGEEYAFTDIMGPIRLVRDGFMDIFQRTLRLDYAFFAAGASLAGCWLMLRRNWRQLLFLLAPVGFCLLASGLDLYPFKDRMLLFVAPIATILIGTTAARATAERRTLVAKILGMIFVVALFVCPIRRMYYDGVDGYEEERVRPAMSFLAQRTSDRPEDLLYVYHDTIPAFRYYRATDNFRIDAPVVEAGAAFNSDEKTRLRNASEDKRWIWILFSHSRTKEQRRVLEFMRTIGKKRGHWETEGARIYLYER